MHFLWAIYLQTVQLRRSDKFRSIRFNWFARVPKEDILVGKTRRKEREKRKKGYGLCGIRDNSGINSKDNSKKARLSGPRMKINGRLLVVCTILLALLVRLWSIIDGLVDFLRTGLFQCDCGSLIVKAHDDETILRESCKRTIRWDNKDNNNVEI